uniref:Uncharacterized protein n=1 Tax=Manihot esculenta TaxID=3983 RepID=A0A2C9V3W9_MANES
MSLESLGRPCWAVRNRRISVGPLVRHYSDAHEESSFITEILEISSIFGEQV